MASAAALAQVLGDFLRDNILAEGIDVGPDTSLADLGVDSFSLMEVILFVERRFGFVMPVEELTPENMATLGALSACLYSLMNVQSPGDVSP
ncbi:MAG: acyl carrier protein [Verrucomicrobia bacterium]|nr:acyl carrier protein [Verrucomicrobiota bacterium]